MKHKQKVTLARKLSGKQTKHFDSPEWLARKEKIQKRVLQRDAAQRLSKEAQAEAN
jgi:hypothetical protein